MAGWSHAADPLGEQARQARKPVVVDFGMTRCGQCIEQGKVLDRLKTAVGDRVLTRFVHIGKEEGLAEACDVFCDEGAFTLEEARRILGAAKGLGFGLRIHAEELQALGGAELAAEMGALSAEHLVHVTSGAIENMAIAGTTAVLLPGTTFFLMKTKYAPS